MMNSPIMFGEWLRQRREGLGLTRKEFARRVGCSISMLRKIEDGERRPSSQIAELFANNLNIPTADRSTFVRVARGEMILERLFPVSKQIANSGISQARIPPRISLPVLPTPLIGRQRDVEQLCQLLRSPQCRLLTLVGLGGIGKTRLAIETAAQVQEDFADGVYFVPLASVTTSRFIVPVIADAIGFSFASGGAADPKTQLFGYLKEKQALLLMDNLEHFLAEPGIEVLAELLTNVPHVKLLVTSHESTGFQGEWVFEVKGLPVPETADAEESLQNTSVELFLQRARRAHVGFNTSADDFPAIIRICQLVSGIPLAIELAAAWVRTLSCDEIAREVERGLGFLSVSARDLPARHRSLQAVFDHSWKLLTEEEQGVLLRLSVFQGGFRREAAEAVADATLSVLSSLVTKSIIRRSGEGRYDLHDLIRQFAADRFAEFHEEQTATQAIHGNFFLTYFGLADERVRSSAQCETLTELTAEMDNLRSAWDWAVTHGEFTLIEQCLRTFAMLYDSRGWLQEGRDTLIHTINILETAIGQSSPERSDLVALGHLLTTCSLFEYRKGQYEQAQVMLKRSIDILSPLNETRILVETITFLGITMTFIGNYASAMTLFSEGLVKATEVGDRFFAALCHTEQLYVALMIGKTEDVYGQLEAAVAEWRSIGDPRFTAFTLNILSLSALILGRYDEARTALEESVELNLSVGAHWNLGNAYQGLGLVAQVQGDHQRAVDMFHKCVDTFNELGGRYYAAQGLALMGHSIFALGNIAEAERVWRESMSMAIEIHGTPVALEALVGFASLQEKRGNLEHALVLLLIVSNHPASTQETRNRAGKLQHELVAQLTSQQVEAAQVHVKTRSFEVTVDEILKSANLS